MTTKNRLKMLAWCLVAEVMSMLLSYIPWVYARPLDTVLSAVVALCLVMLFVELGNPNSFSRNGSLIIDDNDEVYLALDQDVESLKKRSHIDLDVLLSHAT